MQKAKASVFMGEDAVWEAQHTFLTKDGQYEKFFVD